MVVDVDTLGVRLDFDPLDLLPDEADAGAGQELQLALDLGRVRLAMEEGVGADGGSVRVAQLGQLGQAKGHASLGEDGPTQQTGGDHAEQPEADDGESGPRDFGRLVAAEAMDERGQAQAWGKPAVRQASSRAVGAPSMPALARGALSSARGPANPGREAGWSANHEGNPCAERGRRSLGQVPGGNALTTPGVRLSYVRLLVETNIIRRRC